MSLDDSDDVGGEPHPSRLDAFLGAFGLASAAIWVGYLPPMHSVAVVLTPAAWIAAAIAMGWACGARWGWVCVGLGASLGLVIAVDALLIDSIGGEWSGLDKIVLWLGMSAAAVFGALPVLIGTLIHDGRTAPRVARAATRIGRAAVLATVATLTALWLSPATSSFSLALDPSWQVMVPKADSLTASYGHQLTAVYGSTTPPERSSWPVDPVVGVSVTKGRGGHEDCYRAWDAWPGDPSPLYDGPAVEHGRVDLPVGPAYRQVREHQDGSRMIGYAVARSRFVGVVVEPVCYLVVVTMPAGSGLTDADAATIAEAFRFR